MAYFQQLRLLVKKRRLLIALITLIFTGLLSTLVFASNSPAVNSVSNYSHAEIANLLGWKTGVPPKNVPCNLCGGYYLQPNFIVDVPNPPPFKKVPAQVTSQGPVVFSTNGDSILQGNVRITQPGRLVRADKAIIHRDPATGKVITITLIGHVRVEEYGKLLVGQMAIFNLLTGRLIVEQAVYHLAGKHHLKTKMEIFDAWGMAENIDHQSDGIMDMTGATYTTCSPLDPSWVMSAKEINLNKITEKGYAKDVTLRFKGVPILWAPYYSFPLSNARKTGFLSPSIGYSAVDGASIAEPYYWNMAPNYDFLFTPQWYSERGALLHGYFRYLTPNSDGIFYTSFIPYDQGFTQYRNNTLNSSTAAPPGSAPYLASLQNYSSTRGYIDFENDKTFNQYWNSKLYLRYVTDPYFPNDFSSPFLSQNTNQVPSFGQLNYLGDHWNSTLLVQSYQTLHPLTQITTPAQNQYTRLPEFDVSGTYPQFASGFNAAVSAQAVNFDYNSSYYPYTYQRPIGQRFHILPSISRPFDFADGYVTPKLYADSTTYESGLSTVNPGMPRQELDINRTLPIFDIDSGLYFDRDMTFGGGKYIQTLEPRIFYLYTPYLDQDEYPNFDTQSLPFSFMNLYTINQFTGFDRLQNANQLSLGLTTRVLRKDDSGNLLTGQFGFIDYFETPQVCLLPGCQNTPQSISPITGALTYNPNDTWSVNSSIAWDTTLKEINNAEAGVQYQFDNKEIAVLNYTFAHANADTPFNTLGLTTNSSLLTAGFLWPVTHRWNLFLYDYYNLEAGHTESEYGGVSYNTCCWSMRFVVQNAYTGTTLVNNGAANQNTYNTTYYIELLLIGLGSGGNQSAESLLTGTLPGFEDAFSKHSQYGYDEN